MSKIEVDQVDPQSGTTLTLGTSGDTVTIPSGVTLANNGTATGFASIAWQSAVKTANFTAVAAEGYFINTSGGAFEVDLPSSPNVGDEIIFIDFLRTFGTNNLTLDQGSNKFQGEIASTSKPVYDTDGQGISIVYSGSTEGWIPISDDDVANKTLVSYSAEYLSIAGGGAGGKGNAGGGGAGGFLTNVGGAAITLNTGTVYTITVGAGGASSTTDPTRGESGTNSVISGTGLTTITSIGGGGGGSNGSGNGVGRDGGSGGGGNYASAGGSGTSPQGNNGGSGVPAAPAYGAGGGGGAGAVGGNGGGSGAGAGGNGLANSITGSSVTRAGGGGGSTDGSGSAGSGGSGGGGAGAVAPAAASPATANTGGGGGGQHGSTNATGAGGSGIVILSVPDANYSGTTTGSPTVATGVSGKTVITFTGSGSYTA